MSKPLHVRVAKALGWTKLVRHDEGLPWVGLPPGADKDEAPEYVPHFDTDWSAIGPLIVEYKIKVGPWMGQPWKDKWAASYYEWEDGPDVLYGNTPQAAVCWLLLAIIPKLAFLRERKEA